MKEEKEAASGATNTGNGQTKESEPSVSDISEKVKQSQAMGAMVFGPVPKPKVTFSLDHRTEMFMLDTIRKSLDSSFIDPHEKWGIMSKLIMACAGVARI